MVDNPVGKATSDAIEKSSVGKATSDALERSNAAIPEGLRDGEPDHVKVTYNATKRGHAATADTARRIGLSKTDTLNRAAILYEKVTALEAQGGILQVEMPDGKTYRILLI